MIIHVPLHIHILQVNKRHQLSPGKFTVKRKQMQDRKRESRAKTQNSTAMKKRRLQLKAERNYIDQRQEVLEGPSYEPAIVSLEEIDEDAVKEIPPPVQSAPCPEVQANEDDAHVVFDLETTGFGVYSLVNT